MSFDLLARIAHLEQENASLLGREQHFKDFLDNTPVGLCSVAPDGTVLWANRAAFNLLGYARHEYLGRRFLDFHTDSQVGTEIEARFQRGEAIEDYEARLRCRDGSIRHVLISSDTGQQGQGSSYTRLYVKDVTDRKRAERRLRLQYEAGRLLSGVQSLSEAAPALLELLAGELQCASALFWRVDERAELLHLESAWEWATGTANGFVASSRLFTFAPGVGLPGRIWSRREPDWIAEIAQDTNFSRLAAAAEHGLRSAFGFPVMVGQDVFGVIECFCCEPRPVDEDLLQTIGALGFQIGEFLERVRAQERLAEREHSNALLTETATDAIVTIDEVSVIRFANGAAARMFGYAMEELVGSRLTKLMPEHLRPLHDSAMARYVQTGERHLSWQAMPLTGLHRHGYELFLEVSFGEYRQKDKRLFMGIIRDISERKRLEDKLRQTAKLESLGVLAGGIAHDFNNLLTGILGNVSMAADAAQDGSPMQGQLHNALEATARAADLTRQLLAYAGKGRFFVEPIDLSAFIREISVMVRSAVPKHVSMRLDLDPALPPVEADIAQLQQLIMNLVINAAEAVPEEIEGIVLITTRAQHLDAVALTQMMGQTSLMPGHYVVISVRDNGMGMDEATLGRIFDPFFTTKFTGRGLGLAAVLGIVQGHRGALRVLSSPGQGTTFRIVLPASTVKAEPPVTKPPVPATTGSGTVLVVDDEPIVRKIAELGLQRYGYTVITANDGREGIEQFKQRHAELVAVLLDMTMPVMSGEEALVEMRRINSAVPVILSSGYNEVEAIRRFTGKGLAGFIQKPYTALALAQRLALILQS